MSAPNIVNVATITGKTATVALSSTNATAIVSNAASSSKVFKINNVIVSNTISVPADTTLVVLDKNTALYLEEDKSIGAQASVANDLVVVISYEEIS